MATKKKVVKKAAKKKVPVNPLDKKIINSIAKGRNRLEKIVLSINAMGSEINSRLRALKRQGKVAFTAAKGWHIPAADHVPPAKAVTPSPVTPE